MLACMTCSYQTHAVLPTAFEDEYVKTTTIESLFDEDPIIPEKKLQPASPATICLRKVGLSILMKIAYLKTVAYESITALIATLKVYINTYILRNQNS